MGKNPNAARLKTKHHKEKTFETDIDALQEEAARLGCEVWELDQKRKEIESDGEDDGSDEGEEEAKVETKPSKMNKMKSESAKPVP